MEDWLCTFGKRDPSTGACGITSSQQSLVVATLPIGGFFGALLSGPAADFLGRRWSVVLGAVIFAIGIIMQTAATALPLFFAGRVFAGFCVGMGLTLLPIYLSECSPKWIRYVSSNNLSLQITYSADCDCSGSIVSCYEWTDTIGALLASIVNNATKSIPSHASWRISIGIQFVWAVILAVGMIFLPESPRWLIKKGRDEDAARALSRLIGLPPDHPELQAELDEVRLSFQQEKELGESSYLDCFRSRPNKVRLRTLTGIFIQVGLQLTGLPFIFYYSTVFFKNSGIQNPFLITIATNIVLCFMTLAGVVGVEKVGRRRLLLVGAAIMSLCHFLVAIIGVTVSASNTAVQKVLIAFVCIFIGTWSATWGPVSFVVTSEIFPLNIRAKAISMALAANWLLNFAIGYSTPYLINKAPGSAGLGIKVFFIWGSTCAGGFLFAYFCVPEVRISFTYSRQLLGASPPFPDQGIVSRANRPPVPEHHSDALGFVPSTTPTRRRRAHVQRCTTKTRLYFRVQGESLIFFSFHEQKLRAKPSLLRSRWY